MGTRKISQLDTISDSNLSGEAILPIVVSDPLIPNRKAKVNQLFKGLTQGSKTDPGLAFDLDRNTGLYQNAYDQIGLAFGTGTHATTALCLEWLDMAIQGGEKLLDYGCGSGILMIAAVKLGAGTIVAIDNDPQALTAAHQNAARNHVDDVVNFIGVGQDVETDFDVVVANILADPLVTLCAKIENALKSGGRLVLSGIMESQADWVMRSYQNIQFEEPVIRDGWVRLTGRRPAK